MLSMFSCHSFSSSCMEHHQSGVRGVRLLTVRGGRDERGETQWGIENRCDSWPAQMRYVTTDTMQTAQCNTLATPRRPHNSKGGEREVQDDGKDRVRHVHSIMARMQACGSAEYGQNRTISPSFSAWGAAFAASSWLSCTSCMQGLAQLAMAKPITIRMMEVMH